MKLKVLITGSSGQLGTDCIKILSEHYETISCSHKMLDIGEPLNINETLKKIKPHIIVNCAAFTRVDDCETMLEEAYKINRDGPKYLARYAHQLRSKLIHISTDYVFNGNRKIPLGYDETDSPDPVSIYGKSKYAGEQAIMSETDNFLIIRTAWLFGMGGNNFLKTIYRLATNDKGPPLKVINTQYGSFTHSLDLAKQIHQLIVSESQGLYHASGEGYCTWYEGAKYFLKKMGVIKEIQACTEKEFPTKAIRPYNSILNNTKLKKQNINIMPDWKESLDTFASLLKKTI